MIRPRLHDRASATKEELLDHIAAQEHYISWVLEAVDQAKTLMAEMRAKLAKHEPQAAKPTAPAGAFGDIFEGFFGSKKT